MKYAPPAVPDLLRRFVTTPHVHLMQIGKLQVHLESNDPCIVDAIGQSAALASSLPKNTILCKLVRDFDVRSTGDSITFLRDQDIDTLWLGTTTVLCFDRRQREVLGFIAADLDSAELNSTIVPLLLKLLQNCEQIEPSDFGPDCLHDRLGQLL